MHSGADVEEQEGEGEDKEQAISDVAAVDHEAICDHCDFPIFGVRFKCLNCPDYGMFYSIAHF